MKLAGNTLSHGGSISQPDRSQFLPDAPRDKFESMMFAARAANLAVRDIGDEMAAERDELRRAEHRLRELTSGVYLSSEQARARAEDEVAKRKENLARLQRRYDEARPRWEALQRPVQAIEGYLRDVDARALTLAPTVEPKLLKGETAADALNRVRARIDELRIELRMIETAPFPSAIVKSKMRAQIAAMAAAGEPDVMAAIEGGGEIEFRKRHFANHVVGTDGRLVGSANLESVPNADALIAWLFRDQLIAALERKIDENADDASALDDSTRKKKSDRAKAEILAVERDEEALVELCHSHGHLVPRRDDADPRAILGVVGREPKDLFA